MLYQLFFFLHREYRSVTPEFFFAELARSRLSFLYYGLNSCPRYLRLFRRLKINFSSSFPSFQDCRPVFLLYFPTCKKLNLKSRFKIIEILVGQNGIVSSFTRPLGIPLCQTVYYKAFLKILKHRYITLHF